jgi:hypothetical protein
MDDQEMVNALYGLRGRLAILRHQSLVALSKQPEEEELDAGLLETVSRAQVVIHVLDDELLQMQE